MSNNRSTRGVFFIFIFFEKNYRNIFLVLDFTIIYSYRPAGGRQGAYRPARGGRDLCVNKNIFFRRGPWRVPAARQGAAGSRPKYKTPPLPSAPSFSAHEIQRGEREGEGGNSTGEALPDFESKPQVTNISQLCHSRFFVCLIL